jgi:hypothetical protein
LALKCLQCRQENGQLEMDLLPERQEIIIWAKKKRNPETGKRDVDEGLASETLGVFCWLSFVEVS